MSEQSRDKWAKELLTSTLELTWHASEPQARMVADAAAVEVERLLAHNARLIDAGNALEAQLDRPRIKIISDLTRSGVDPENITTSLARLKAEWQAELLETMLASHDGSNWSAQQIEDWANYLQRQAKEK